MASPVYSLLCILLYVYYPPVFVSGQVVVCSAPNSSLYRLAALAGLGLLRAACAVAFAVNKSEIDFGS
jgi:hypothetical protein